MEALFLQGRSISPAQLEWIRSLLRQNAGWGRSRLSVHIAQSWNWRNQAGALKDMAARTLLLKLERSGLIALPPARTGGGGSRKAIPPDPAQPSLFAPPKIHSSLAALMPVDLALACSAPDRKLFASLLGDHHYLGYSRPVGENLQYLARDASGQVLACLLFGAAAWKCAPRDQFIGWTRPQREGNLCLLANNSRFLILPWVRVPHLASWLLSRAVARLSRDWLSRYGHPIWLVETFVQRERFSGVCYRAANWLLLGQTTGRTRNGSSQPVSPIKDIYARPTHRNFRNHLQQANP